MAETVLCHLKRTHGLVPGVGTGGRSHWPCVFRLSDIIGTGGHGQLKAGRRESPDVFTQDVLTGPAVHCPKIPTVFPYVSTYKPAVPERITALISSYLATVFNNINLVFHPEFRSIDLFLPE